MVIVNKSAISLVQTIFNRANMARIVIKTT